MRIDEIESRKAEIKASLEAEDTSALDIDALTEEIRSLNEEKAEIEERNAKEAELRSMVAPEVVAAINTNIEKEERKMENIITRNSPEYVEAFAKYIKTGSDKECRALLSENATNGTVAVPELVSDIIRHAWEKDGIMKLVKKSFIKGNLKVGFEISGPDAVTHNEGAAVDEEALVMGIVNLVPKSLKKWVSISDEALDLTGEAYLRYIYEEVAEKIAHKAACELVANIEACGTASTTTCPAVPAITEATIGVDTIAKAIAQLSDEAANPVIMMNKTTWAAFKGVQYGADYAVDVFEGLPVLFNNSITAYSAATTGVTYAIVGDLGQGALANFPNGEEITFKYDDKTLMTSDLVRILGREFVGLGVVAPNAFVKVQK